MLDIIEHIIFDPLLYHVGAVSPAANLAITNQNNLVVNFYIEHFHRVLGIILRSTNPRNSFEIYDPILRLAKRLLPGDTVLILSCEWEFVPFTTPSIFGGMPDCPNCTVVGLPVMEAGNALVTPLAGHELGHAVWRARSITNELSIDRERALCAEFRSRPEEFVRHVPGVDLYLEGNLESRIATNEWGRVPLEVMDRVSEEVFCDMLGVRLFGMGYLYAFEYLVAPSLGGTDLQRYPAIDDRVGYLLDAMADMVRFEGADPPGHGVISPGDSISAWLRLEGYQERFKEEPQRKLDVYEEFLLDSAHNACGSLVARLKALAATVCDADEGNREAIARPTLAGAKEKLRRLECGLPATGDLADLANAGWLGYLLPSFWSDRPKWKDQKFRLLNELVFKSLDVTEFERRTNASQDGQTA